MTMAITTLVFFRVLTDRWHWARWKAFAVCVPMLVVDPELSRRLEGNDVDLPSVDQHGPGLAAG